MAIKWSESDVIAAFEQAMAEADAMPSMQQMMQELMTEAERPLAEEMPVQ